MQMDGDYQLEDILSELQQNKRIQSNNTFQASNFNQSSWNFQMEKIQKPKIKKQASKTKAQNSLHHNAIKHAINTIKTLISIESLDKNEENQIFNISKLLWEKFLKSRKFNKNILKMLYFTKYELNQIHREYKIQSNDFFFDVKRKFTMLDIRKAQQSLIDLTIQSINKQSLQKHLKDRKILDKESFKLYLLNIIEQLKQGSISTRLSPERSNKITEYSEINKYLDL